MADPVRDHATASIRSGGRPPDADVLIVGGGIAGLSAAWFAARTGRDVTVVDEGRHRASDLPVALINPLRGHRGRSTREGIDGMHATFALIDALRADGHAIAHGRGLHRPLLGLSGDASTEAFWHARLASRLAFAWSEQGSAHLGLVEDAPSLFLPEPGWVAAPQLLRALRTASGATCIDARVVAIVADGDGGGTVTLSDGARLAARSLLWAGGAWGAAGLEADAPADMSHDGLYKPGGLMAADASVARVPMAFGLYAIPVVAGMIDGLSTATLVGPTREAPQSRFDATFVPSDAVAHLQDRVARSFGATIALKPVWRGVRLARLSGLARRRLGASATLTALDSRGFLMAPALAAAWARSL